MTRQLRPSDVGEFCPHCHGRTLHARPGEEFWRCGDCGRKRDDWNERNRRSKTIARKKKNPADAAELRRYDRALPCELSDLEVNDKAKALAILVRTKAEKEDAKRAATKAMGEEIGALEVQIADLGKVVETHQEERTVLCVERLSGAQVLTVRLDTDEIVEQRAARPEELQETMFEETAQQSETTV